AVHALEQRVRARLEAREVQEHVLPLEQPREDVRAHGPDVPDALERRRGRNAARERQHDVVATAEARVDRAIVGEALVLVVRPRRDDDAERLVAVPEAALAAPEETTLAQVEDVLVDAV